MFLLKVALFQLACFSYFSVTLLGYLDPQNGLAGWGTMHPDLSLAWSSGSNAVVV